MMEDSLGAAAADDEMSSDRKSDNELLPNSSHWLQRRHFVFGGRGRGRGAPNKNRNMEWNRMQSRVCDRREEVDVGYISVYVWSESIYFIRP